MTYNSYRDKVKDSMKNHMNSEDKAFVYTVAMIMVIVIVLIVAVSVNSYYGAISNNKYVEICMQNGGHLNDKAVCVKG